MDERGKPPPPRRTHLLRDLAVALLGGLIAFALASALDLSERVRSWAGEHVHLEVVEVLVGLVVFAVGMGFFSVLSHRDLRREIAAHESTEARLREGEERYRDLVEQVPAVTYVWDSSVAPGEGPAPFISPQLRSLMGFTPEEWQGDPGLWHRQTHPDDVDRVLADWALAAAAGRPFNAEYRMRTKAGRTVWIRDEALPVGTGAGGKPLYQGVMIDITERRRAEEAVREAETKYRTLVEQLPVVTYRESVDERNRLLYISPQIEGVLGFTPEEWSADPDLWVRQLHPEDRERVVAEHDLSTEKGEPFSIEYRVFRKDGHLIWVHNQAALVRDGRGDPMFWQGIVLDITERKRAEEALHRRDAVLEAVTFAAERFLRAETWEEAIPEVLFRLGISAQLSRVYVFENERDTDGSLLMAPRFEWTAPGVAPTTADPVHRPYDDGFDRWRESLQAGNVLHGVIADLPGSERDALAPKGTLSVAIAPITVGEDWWGFIGFDDCVDQREWSAVEVDALRAAAGVLGAAIALEQAMRRIRDEEVRYRSLVETMPAAIYLEPVGESYATLYISPRIEAISGYPADRWIADEDLWVDILHPEDRDRVLAADRASAATGEPFGGEYRIIHADGRTVWVRDEAVLVRDDQGHPRYWQGFMLDVTNRKLAEERVQETEERYRTLVEQLPVVVYIDSTDEISSALYVSPQYLPLLGYTPEERLADPELWLRMLHPDDRDRVLAESARTNETGEPFACEYRLIAKDGRIIWVRDEAILIRDEKGAPRFWQGVLLDVTERRSAEERLGRRDAVLGAVGFAAERFLMSPAWEEGIAEVLDRLGRAADASRIYVFENKRTDDGAVLHTLRHEWLADGASALDGGTNGRYREGFGRWERVLGSGGVIQVSTGELPDTERRALEDEGVRSQAVIPVFVGDEWWGFVGFDSRAAEREWAQVEIDALRAAADTLGAAIGRERAERRIASAERRLRTLVENIPAITYIHPPLDEPGVRYISPQVQNVLGYAPDEWLSDPERWTHALHPDDRERVLETDRRTDETGDPFSVEYRQFAKDGRVVWVRDEAVLVRDEDGTPLYWQGVRLDITRLKEVEQQVREAEERYRTLVETIPAIVYIDRVDELATSVYISPQVADVLGYAPEEWVEEPDAWAGGLHPDDRERVMAALARHNEAGEPFDLEYRMRHRDGRWVWIRDSALVVRDEGGRIHLSQGVMLDVTEQKEAEQQLRETQERFKALVEHIPAVLYVDHPDPDAPAIYVGPQLTDLFGVTTEEYLAEPGMWYRLVHPDDRQEMLSAYERTIEKRRPWRAEYRIVRPDGRVVWVRDEASLLLDERGEPRLVQGVIFDITEQKVAEEALRESEQREREAADRLRTLDEMKNTFLAAVSHELRSPLTSILGLALTLERQEGLAPEDRTDLLGRLATNARKLDRLLKDLLDIDRLNRGIVTLNQRWTDVGALVRRTVETLEAVADRTVNVEADPVSVSCDAAKVERIVENLVVNATRHTRGEARIWVRVRAADGGALILVEDDGPGVPEDLKRAIFEPFRQGPATNTAAPGTGIGLSLVARFVELHGGRAWVEDRTGGGASFRVFLPGTGGNGHDITHAAQAGATGG